MNPSGKHGRGRASGRTIELTLRVEKALELRQSGMSHQEIANRLGYNSRQAVFMAIKKSLERTLEESTEEYRKIVGARLDRALKAIWPKVIKGDAQAIHIFLQIHDRIVKLYGVNKTIDINVQADQLNVQNNVQTNVTMKFDLKSLSEEQLGKYEQLLADYSSILTANVSRAGGPEGGDKGGASASGNGHAPEVV